jgi:hypothetical protein
MVNMALDFTILNGVNEITLSEASENGSGFTFLSGGNKSY